MSNPYGRKSLTNEEFASKCVIQDKDLKQKFMNKFQEAADNALNSKHPKYKRYEGFLTAIEKMPKIDDRIARSLLQNVEMSDEEFASYRKSNLRKSAEQLLKSVRRERNLSPEDLLEVSKTLNEISRELTKRSEELIKELKTQK